MTTTQPAAEGGAKTEPETKAKTKETKGAEAVPVSQEATSPFAYWHTDMERLMEDMFKSWSGLPALKPFAGFLAPLGNGEAPGLDAWRDQADKYFEDLSRRWGDLAKGGPLEALGLPAAFVLKPDVDISEGDDSYVLKAELPGMDKDDLAVEIDGDVLAISGMKSETSDDKGKNFSHRERRFGSFRRAFRLPENAVTSKAEASFDKGVLTVTVPKQAEAKGKGRKVPVKG